MVTHQSEDLPRRVFLDSSTLQTLQNYGGFIWENEPIAASNRIFRIPDGFQNVEALQNIFRVNQRAMFEFALSENSMREVHAKSDSHYMQWAYDVLDHWLACIEESGAETERSGAIAEKLESKSFGYLGAGDRALIKDAVAFGCDAFLTMERRLPRNAPHVCRELGIRILTPIQHWNLLRPFAALWY